MGLVWLPFWEARSGTSIPRSASGCWQRWQARSRPATRCCSWSTRGGRIEQTASRSRGCAQLNHIEAERSRMSRDAPSCSHFDQIEVTALPTSIEGCEECLKIGSRWVHLRMCMTCGKIGCCDSSPNKHATAHAHESDHPVIRSAEPGEDWSWCYVDEVAFRIPSS